MIDVEGYTAENPIAEEDWRDEVQWQVEMYWTDRQAHDSGGYICEMAGSEKCLALGHVEPEDGWSEDPDGHPIGWQGDALCPETKFEEACTLCEGPVSECEAAPTDVHAFWRLFHSDRVTSVSGSKS